jgi:hypothetical protein
MSARAFRKPRPRSQPVTSCRFDTGRISEICPGTRARGEGAGNDVFLMGENAMQIKHLCPVVLRGHSGARGLVLARSQGLFGRDAPVVH